MIPSRLLATGMCAVVAVGCTASHDYGRDFDSSAVQKIEPGMKKDQVEALLGKPFNVTSSGETEYWQYTYNTLDRTLTGAAFVPVYGAFASDAVKGESRSKRVVIRFQDDSVAGCSFMETASSGSSGLMGGIYGAADRNAGSSSAIRSCDGKSKPDPLTPPLLSLF